MLRYHFDGHDLRLVTIAIRHPLRNPTAEDPVLMGLFLQTLSTAMRRCVDGLEQQQAAIGVGKRDPATSRFFDQVLVILAQPKPRSESLKPFCPDAFPWQPPPLQPSFVKMGIIVPGKLISDSLPMLATRISV